MPSIARCALVLAASLVLALAGPASVAVAGSFDPSSSVLEVQIGSGPRVVFPMDTATVTLGSGPFGDEILFIAPSATVFGPSTSFFSGLLPLSVGNATVAPADPVTPFLLGDGVTNNTPFLNQSFTGFGATTFPIMLGEVRLETPSGDAVVVALPVAGGANRLSASCGNGPCTFGRLHTAPAAITGVSTPRIQVDGSLTGAALTLEPTAAQTVKVFTTGGGFTSTGAGPTDRISTVTVAGSNDLAGPSNSGSVVLVTPVRIDTGPIGGILPGMIRTRLSFVPEPESLLLQLAGVAGLLLVGRWKRQQRR